MNQFNQAKKRHLKKEPGPVFVKVPILTDTSHPVGSGKHSFKDNRPMLYFQGMKLYVPDDFNQDTLLRLLQTMKQL